MPLRAYFLVLLSSMYMTMLYMCLPGGSDLRILAKKLLGASGSLLAQILGKLLSISS